MSRTLVHVHLHSHHADRGVRELPDGSIGDAAAVVAAFHVVAPRWRRVESGPDDYGYGFTVEVRDDDFPQALYERLADYADRNVHGFSITEVGSDIVMSYEAGDRAWSSEQYAIHHG